jgi:hypothetical protein
MEVFLIINGIGHGHLSRALQASAWLRRAGRRPVIFFQGDYLPSVTRLQIGLSYPALYSLPRARAQILANEIARYATLSRPALIIEDTHPAPVSVPHAIRRILLVRPTEFDYLVSLQSSFASLYDRFILCDRPGSPSWPYAEGETAELLRWKNWVCLEPIFRRSRKEKITQIRCRYNLRKESLSFVFSMGAGGQRDGSNDCLTFVQRSAEIAEQLRSFYGRVRLLFVCGPLFPPQIRIPEHFEVIEGEPDLHALFAACSGAVIRPGFNSMWECIGAGIPFLPVHGTTYEEPVKRRLQRMAKFGLVVPDTISAWRDNVWLESYKQACSSLLTLYSGEPKEQFMAAIATGTRRRISIAAMEFGERPAKKKDELGSLEYRAQIARISGATSLIIRMDDVVEADESVAWLCDLCQKHDLYASIEVIPYLTTLQASQLDALDKECRIEVSQHGYAHLPHRDASGCVKGEFVNDGCIPSEFSARRLATGYRLMRRRFRGRFKGGYSAPFDGLPIWLPSVWERLGGTYISWIWTLPLNCHGIRHICMGVDPWNWTSNAQHPWSYIVERTVQSLRKGRYLGLVLHAQLLRISQHKEMVESLIELCVDAGMRGRRLSECALTAIPREAERPRVE